MTQSEFSDQNYKRIFWINGMLSIPIFLLFAWPYYELGKILSLPVFLIFSGAIFFSLSFMLTMLHGHVTMSLGILHRNHYYKWLNDHPFTYGLFFHPVMIRTRFRLLLIIISLLIMLTGVAYPYITKAGFM
ncbi:MAG TPA: hypothetical protein VKA34_08405 [Balneolales bacterium]|nr:hypothetical protein [Balneolales bacterium]